MSSSLTSSCPRLSSLLCGFSCGPPSFSNGRIPCKIQKGFLGKPSIISMAFDWSPCLEDLPHSHPRLFFETHIFHHAALLLTTSKDTELTHGKSSQGPRFCSWCRVETLTMVPGIQALMLGQVGHMTEGHPDGFLLWESLLALGNLQPQG